MVLELKRVKLIKEFIYKNTSPFVHCSGKYSDKTLFEPYHNILQVWARMFKLWDVENCHNRIDSFSFALLGSVPHTIFVSTKQLVFLECTSQFSCCGSKRKAIYAFPFSTMAYMTRATVWNTLSKKAACAFINKCARIVWRLRSDIDNSNWKYKLKGSAIDLISKHSVHERCWSGSYQRNFSFALRKQSLLLYLYIQVWNHHGFKRVYIK